MPDHRSVQGRTLQACITRNRHTMNGLLLPLLDELLAATNMRLFLHFHRL